MQLRVNGLPNWKYVKLDKRLNYFRRKTEAGFMQSAGSKSRSTLLPALNTTWLLDAKKIIPFKKRIQKYTPQTPPILVRVLLSKS